MIPVPSGPRGYPSHARADRPIPRGGERAPPLVLQAFNEIDDLRRMIADVRKPVEALEHRFAGLDALEQRVAAFEAKG